MNFRLHAVPTACLALLALACGPSAESAAPAATASTDAYVVRGEIVRLPAAAGGDLFLHHESIPDFRDSKGETVGMMSMTMQFKPADAVDLSGFSPGDRAEVAFEVQWEPKPSLHLTRIDPLPQGTRLEFDPAEPEPPGDEPVEDGDEGEDGESVDLSR